MTHQSVVMSKEARQVTYRWKLTKSRISLILSYRPRFNYNYDSCYRTKQKKKTNSNKDIYTTRKYPIIIFPENIIHTILLFWQATIISQSPYLKTPSHGLELQCLATWEWTELTHHLCNPEQRDSSAGIHIKGSKAARKSPSVGTWSSLDFTTSK